MSLLKSPNDNYYVSANWAAAKRLIAGIRHRMNGGKDLTIDSINGNDVTPLNLALFKGNVIQLNTMFEFISHQFELIFRVLENCTFFVNKTSAVACVITHLVPYHISHARLLEKTIVFENNYQN